MDETDKYRVEYGEGAAYHLNVDEAAGNITPSKPEEILHFRAEEQILIIQKELGVEQTGKWDSTTNETFALWLRMQQAEHMVQTPEDRTNINKVADGWWGKNTQAALEGKINAEVFNAIKGLYERENGGLRNLTSRTRVHNASFEEVKSEIDDAEFSRQAPADGEIALEAAIPAGGAGLLASSFNDRRGAGPEAKGKPIEPEAKATRSILPVEETLDGKKAHLVETTVDGKPRTVEILDSAHPQGKPSGLVSQADDIIDAEFREVPPEEDAKLKAKSADTELKITDSQALEPQGKLIIAEDEVNRVTAESLEEPDGKTTTAIDGEEPKVSSVVEEAEVKANNTAIPEDTRIVVVAEEGVLKADNAPLASVVDEAMPVLDGGEKTVLLDMAPQPLSPNTATDIIEEGAGNLTSGGHAPDVAAVPNGVESVVEETMEAVDDALGAGEKALENSDQMLSVAGDMTEEALEEAPLAQTYTAFADELSTDVIPGSMHPLTPEVANLPPAMTEIASIPQSTAMAVASDVTPSTSVALPVSEEEAGKAASFVAQLWDVAVDSKAMEYLGKTVKVVGRALPLVGAGVATADSAYAGMNAQDGINAGLINEDAMLALGAGYAAHVAQGGFDPTFFGGEVGTMAAFDKVTEEYNIDPVLGSMVRPMLLVDLADDLFGDGMPELEQEQVEALSRKYSDENMAPIYGMIIEKYGLPGTVNATAQGNETPITEAVRNEDVLDRLKEYFEAEGNDQAVDGVNALAFSTQAQDRAHIWVAEHERQQTMKDELGVSQKDEMDLSDDWISP